MKKISKEILLQLCDNIIQDNLYLELQTFNEEMLISQVVRFFEKHGKKFTKTMIQNYVRVGVLPTAIDKRYYTRNHLIMLILIDNLKSIYSLDEIKTIFAPILKNPGTFDDDLIQASELYDEYIKYYKKALESMKDVLPITLNEINGIFGGDDINEEDKNIAVTFLTTLTLMTQSIVLKKLVMLTAEEIFKKEE